MAEKLEDVLHSVLPNPIPQIRTTLAWARFNNINAVSWQIDTEWHAAFENQAIFVKRIVVDAGAPLPELSVPTMGNIPYSVNAYLPEGTAVLIDANGNIVKILKLK